MVSAAVTSAVQHIADRIRGRTIPFIPQMSEGECGAACLAMVLGFHGCVVDRRELREQLAVGRDGSNAHLIVRAARAHGFRARGINVDLDQFIYLPPATILHWNFNHFVVLERSDASAVEILDPGAGRLRVTYDELAQSFTGVAILVESTVEARTARRGAASRTSLLRRAELGGEGKRLWRVFVTSLFLQVLGLSLPMVTGLLIDHVIPHADRTLLLVTTTWVVVIVAFFFLATLVRGRLLLHLRTSIDARLTTSFLAHLLRLPYSFYEQRSVGDLALRLNSNATVREILTAGVLSALLDGTFAGLSILLLLCMDLRIGLVVLGLAATQLAVIIGTRDRQRELLAKDLNAQVRSQSYQFEMLRGARSIKAMGFEDRAEERWSNLFFDVLNAALDRGALATTTDAALSALRVAAPLVILALGAQAVLDQGQRLGPMLGMTALATSALVPIAGLVNTAGQIHVLQAYGARLEDVFESRAEEEGKLPELPPIVGTVDVESVSFSYTRTGPLVVNDVSLSIAAGSFVAIVGPSGSGKSTLASLLLGLYAPNAGCVRVDGKDLRTVDVRSFRRQIGYVAQSLDLFSGSIRSNIAIGDSTLSMEKIEAAAQFAALADDIGKMPMGYETLVGEQAGALSGGQGQRLAIARALARSPALLILDEATSALDADAEARVQAVLKNLSVTRIVIAHRLSTVVHADQIIVMNGGRVVEQGTHLQLLKQNGSYATLVRAQLGPSTTGGVG